MQQSQSSDKTNVYAWGKIEEGCMTFEQHYPNAFEDAKGTIWVSHEAAESADWTFEQGDGFLASVLGWSWPNARDNFALYRRELDRRAHIAAHPRLYAALRWIRSRYHLLTMFLSLCRPSYELGPALAWKLSADLWLGR